MTRTRSWTASLQDSVFALGAAARETQRAYQAAVIAADHVDLDRLRLLDGRVLRRDAGSTGHEPHLGALSRINDLQLNHMFRLKDLYTEAARAYAHGTTWAVRQVQAGQRPEHVVLAVGDDGHYLFPATVAPLQLDRYAGAAAVGAARARYERCLDAGDTAEEIDAQAYVPDHEAGQLHQALDIAAGLPDAAYAYGVAAEGALHYAINTRPADE
ncbi:hypothetical protein [Streptomyces sp. CRN 30]|uniref:hypothetical protein n=1 Tax=Streptomyces sp. CRN 30 TaxID=3075613 RepID=UPI002A7F297F|nr:hypothetical protein [Streptomyces sp. CRN 30]